MLPHPVTGEVLSLSARAPEKEMGRVSTGFEHAPHVRVRSSPTMSGMQWEACLRRV